MNTENNNLKGPMDEQLANVRTLDGRTTQMSMEEIQKEDLFLQRGIDLANMLVDKAISQKDVSGEFLVLRYAAIHLLGGQIFKIGIGAPVEGQEQKYDASRAFAAEKEVQEHLTSNVTAWKNLFDNGQLKFTKAKG